MLVYISKQIKTKPYDYISRELGFLPGSFERNPKIKRETKKITTIYTNILSANIQ